MRRATTWSSRARLSCVVITSVALATHSVEHQPQHRLETLFGTLHAPAAGIDIGDGQAHGSLVAVELLGHLDLCVATQDATRLVGSPLMAPCLPRFLSEVLGR